MKKLLPILFVLIITSCSKEIPSDQLVKRSDLYYEVNSKKPFTGKMVSYYENGQLKYEGSLSDGKYIGLHQRYCQNGEINSQLNYPSGSHKNWRCGSGGILNYEGNYKNGFKEGTWTNYDSYGEIFDIENYKEGKKHGLQEDYLCGGSVKEREIYQEGKRVYIEEYDYGGRLEKKYCFLNKMECSKIQFPPNVRTRSCR